MLVVASQQEGPGFDSGPFCVGFARSPCVYVGPLWVLQLPSTIQRPTSGDRSIGDSKLLKGVNFVKHFASPEALSCQQPIFSELCKLHLFFSKCHNIAFYLSVS